MLLAWSMSSGAVPLGVDGVAIRPLAPIAFEATIVQHLPALDRRREERTDESDSVRSAIDLARLGDHAETRLAEFARSLPAMVSAVMLAIARGDADGICNAAGALRVLCLESGALPLAALAEEFERLGEARDLPGCSQAAGELHGALRHALAFCSWGAAPRPRRGPSPPEPPLDTPR